MKEQSTSRSRNRSRANDSSATLVRLLAGTHSLEPALSGDERANVSELLTRLEAEATAVRGGGDDSE
jgi:hypothetical protein